ncbi:MAG: hypothetical protein IIB06_00065 [Bacteroidetes bacterium]|nr:hypothetical protein [Bacteroidota bacterium]
MKKTILISLITILLFVQCEKESNRFLIQKGAIGNLTKSTPIKQIDSIFAQDSIVWLNPINNSLGIQGEIEIFEKGGKKLLLLSPENENDSNSVITNIQVFDDRYKTEQGFNSGSTFKDLKENYKITAIDNAINSVVIYLEDSEIFITIDKKQLPENVRYNYTTKIESTQIPLEATFKYFMIAWDVDDEITDEN